MEFTLWEIHGTSMGHWAVAVEASMGCPWDIGLSRKDKDNLRPFFMTNDVHGDAE
jgi:hypothetical protein